MPRPRTRPRSRPSIEPLEGRALLATLMVTNTLDSGVGSLRRAILDADSANGASTIDFAIPGALVAGAQTISPATSLPAITEPVMIDGTTEPGYNGSPVVAIDGANQKISTGLEFDYGSTGSMVRGLAVDAFSYAGILVVGPQVSLQSDSIGLNPAGLVGGSGVGVDILGGNNSPTGNTAAGPGSVVTGSIIAGNGDGIDLMEAVKATVSNNDIGTDGKGRTDIGNTRNGISISGTTVATTISGNTIADNGRAAIQDDSGGGVTLSSNIEGNNGNLNANLVVTSSVPGPLGVNPGQAETITYTVTNEGPNAAAGATLDVTSRFAQGDFDLEDRPSPIFAFVGAVASEGTVAPGLGATSRLASFGTIAAGASATLTVTVQVTGSGSDDLDATASSQASTTVPPGRSNSIGFSSNGTADIAVAALPPAPARVGVPETFAFVVTNKDPNASADALFGLSFGPTVFVATFGVQTSQGTVMALPQFPDGFGGDLGRLAPGASAVVIATIIPPAGGVVSASLYAYSAYDADPAPANNLAFAASLAISPAPTLLGAVVEQTGATVTTLSVYFDGALDASEAQNVANYRLTLAGSTVRIPLASARYSATPNYGTIHIVSLQLAKPPIKAGQTFRLLVGRAGLTGADGSKLLNAVAPLTASA